MTEKKLNCRKFGVLPSEYSEYYPMCECLDDDCDEYRLEQCYSLDNDPHLPNTEICARVFTDRRYPVKTRVILRRCETEREKKLDMIQDSIVSIQNQIVDMQRAGEDYSDIHPLIKRRESLHKRKREFREGMVTCIHSKLTDIAPEDLPESQYEFEDIEPKEHIKLHPVEHFIALSSWVEGIKEFGVENILKSSLTEEDLDMPFGFNWELQRQFIRALHKTNPDTAELFAVDILMDIYTRIKDNPDYDFSWVQQRYKMLMHYFELGCPTDIDVFIKCIEMGEIRSMVELIRLMLQSTEDQNKIRKMFTTVGKRSNDLSLDQWAFVLDLFYEDPDIPPDVEEAIKKERRWMYL